MSQDLPLVEPFAIAEVFIDGIARIEQVGPNLKLAFYSLQRPAGGAANELERVIVARFVMPAVAVHAAAILAMTASETVVMLDRH